MKYVECIKNMLQTRAVIHLAVCGTQHNTDIGDVASSWRFIASLGTASHYISIENIFNEFVMEIHCIFMIYYRLCTNPPDF